MDLIREKIDQARRLVAASDLDCWCTFVRETSEGADPVLGFLVEGALTWQSALLVFKSGKTVAVLGNYDADPLVATGHWDEIVPYVQGIREPLISSLRNHLPSGGRVGLNTSRSDVKADGLTHGMYMVLKEYLDGSMFELVSAEAISGALRSRKTMAEVERMRGAISVTDELFDQVPAWCDPPPTELELYRRMQAWIDERGYGFSWERAGDPIVNFGPDSMIGHGRPSDKIRLSPGHILHIDLGIIKDGYSSDIQRCWYVPHPGETTLPDDVARACEAVVGAIDAGAAVLRPGVEGWQVDAAARSYLVSQGCDEYLHAFGHQVGKVAHDGGAILGPKWERYGQTPMMPIEIDQAYTLELGVILPDRGYLGLEEMVVVREDGLEWLTNRQLSVPILLT